MDSNQPLAAYEFVDFDALPGINCPCGTAKRAFLETADFPASIHITQISESAVAHFHKVTTEVYVVLECEHDACLELNGEPIPLKPMNAVLIRPGTIHRAIGSMKVMIIAQPTFDPNDEFPAETGKHYIR